MISTPQPCILGKLPGWVFHDYVNNKELKAIGIFVDEPDNVNRNKKFDDAPKASGETTWSSGKNIGWGYIRLCEGASAKAGEIFLLAATNTELERCERKTSAYCCEGLGGNTQGTDAFIQKQPLFEF